MKESVFVSPPADLDKLQAAIDKVSASGGGTVYVAPGEYSVAFLELKDNVTLDLAPGARLVADVDTLLARAKSSAHEHDQANALIPTSSPRTSRYATADWLRTATSSRPAPPRTGFYANGMCTTS